MNTQASLDRAKDGLVRALARITELKVERESQLLADDQTGDVKGIDREIVEHENDAQIYKQRIAALEAELRDQRFAEWCREQERKIEETERVLADRTADCYELDAAIKHVGEVFFRMTARRAEMMNVYPHELLPSSFSTLQGSRVMQEVSWSQWYAGKPDAMNNRPKIATPSAMPGVQGIHQLGVGGAAESEARALVAQLRRELAAKTVDDFAEIGSAA